MLAGLYGYGSSTTASSMMTQPMQHQPLQHHASSSSEHQPRSDRRAKNMLQIIDPTTGKNVMIGGGTEPATSDQPPTVATVMTATPAVITAESHRVSSYWPVSLAQFNLLLSISQSLPWILVGSVITTESRWVSRYRWVSLGQSLPWSLIGQSLRCHSCGRIPHCQHLQTTNWTLEQHKSATSPSSSCSPGWRL